MTPQPMSRHAINSRSKLGSRYSGIRVIETIVYVQPMNTRPDSKDWYIAFITMIGINKKDYVKERSNIPSM